MDTRWTLEEFCAFPVAGFPNENSFILKDHGHSVNVQEVVGMLGIFQKGRNNIVNLRMAIGTQWISEWYIDFPSCCWNALFPSVWLFAGLLFSIFMTGKIRTQTFLKPNSPPPCHTTFPLVSGVSSHKVTSPWQRFIILSGRPRLPSVPSGHCIFSNWQTEESKPTWPSCWWDSFQQWHQQQGQKETSLRLKAC